MRADRWLTEQGLAPSRTKAAEWIRSGFVRIDGRSVTRPSEELRDDLRCDEVVIDTAAACSYVSRGALKLIDALDAWQIDVTGKSCADFGASTGGFTQVLLERGARRVVAIDVGSDQLHPLLREHPGVCSMEGCNLRHVTAREIASRCGDALPFDCMTCDLSFISLTLVLPSIAALAAEGADLIALIKPQFEVGRRYVGKGGIVRSEQARRKALLDVTAAAARAGFELRGTRISPIRGGDGNIEYLAHFRYHPTDKEDETI